ncbi:MAG: S49 family peptidase [Steroidobacteraceae bacterium]
MTNPQPHGTRRAKAWLAAQQWAITPEAFQTIVEIGSRQHEPDFDAVLARQGELLTRGLDAQLRGDTAIIEVVGPIFRYASMFSRISGATSVEQLAYELQAALDSPRVKQVVLAIDSPGGAVTGISDFAKLLRGARKPVVAFVGGSAASAGYWIASAAPWVVVSDTALLGSIGVVSMLRVDADVNVLEIVSSQSPNKRPDLKSDAGRAVVQGVVDQLAGVFISAVAIYRNTTPDRVIADFGGGSVLVGRAAVAADMADEVGTLEGLLAGFHRGEHPAVTRALRQKAALAPHDVMASQVSHSARPGDTSPVLANRLHIVSHRRY